MILASMLSLGIREKRLRSSPAQHLVGQAAAVSKRLIEGKPVRGSIHKPYQ